MFVGYCTAKNTISIHLVDTGLTFAFSTHWQRRKCAVCTSLQTILHVFYNAHGTVQCFYELIQLTFDIYGCNQWLEYEQFIKSLSEFSFAANFFFFHLFVLQSLFFSLEHCKYCLLSPFYCWKRNKRNWRRDVSKTITSMKTST